MELLSYYLHQGLSFIVPLVILLGLLIFVHELGHFLVAKFYGVRVEVFSLGFGKKILKHKRGDTEYCISAIPFGGYVKMYGDDPTADVPEENKSVSFSHKPVGQRIAVVLAGPLMNLFFAMILFFIIALVGEDVVKPIVGDLSTSSAAYQAGLRPNDSVISVNNQPVHEWGEIKKKIEDNAEGPIKIEVNREGLSSPLKIASQTKLTPNPNILSNDTYVGDIDGLTFLFRASIIAINGQNTPAAKAGLQTGDRITQINGQSVDRWDDLSKVYAQSIGDVKIVFERDREHEKTLSQTITLPAKTGTQNGTQALLSMGIDQPDLYISKIIEGSAAAEAGLKKGDKVISLNGEIAEWGDLVKRVQAYKAGEPPLKLVILRDSEKIEKEITPKKIKQSSHAGSEGEVFAIGVMAGTLPAQPLTFVERAPDIGSALDKGVSNTWLWTKNTALSFLRLVQRRVSAKSIGGVITIGQLASRSFEIGLSPFLKMMSIISINLFLLNLLPVPVLDGGHLLFFSIEALRGAPLSMRKMEIAQQIGLALLMSLMALALFNDVSRLFN